MIYLDINLDLNVRIDHIMTFLLTYYKKSRFK